jgi:hypothetical protein
MVDVRNFEAFRAQAEAVVNTHPIVLNNSYTKWFATGVATRGEVRHLTVQFSVFSHLFVEAQLRKVINAPTIEEYRAGKEILMNELGVLFRKEGSPALGQHELAVPELIGSEGTVDGSRYRHVAAHFEWLLRFGEGVGLAFDEMGKRRRI